MASEVQGAPRGLDRYLTSSERVLYACRRHPVVLARVALLWLGAVAAGAAIGLLVSPGASESAADLAAGWLVLAATAYTGWRVARWAASRYVVTGSRVLLVEGLVARTVSSVPFSRVTDTTYRRSIAGRLLGYGDLLLDTAGERPGLSALSSVPHPDRVYRIVASLVAASSPAPGSRSRRDPDDTGPLPRVIP